MCMGRILAALVLMAVGLSQPIAAQHSLKSEWAAFDVPAAAVLLDLQMGPTKAASRLTTALLASAGAYAGIVAGVGTLYACGYCGILTVPALTVGLSAGSASLLGVEQRRALGGAFLGFVAAVATIWITDTDYFFVTWSVVQGVVTALVSAP